VSIVYVSPVANRFNDEDVLALVPGDDRAVVAGAELVVGPPLEALEAVVGPFLGFGELLENPLAWFGVQSFQVLVGLQRDYSHD